MVLRRYRHYTAISKAVREMMRQDTIDQSALWLADELSRAADDKSSRFALDRIRRGIEAGTTTLDQAVQELSGGQKAQPGEFGFELAGATW